MSDTISYRTSWPRPATPTNLQPKWAGEFRDHADWVSFATTRLTGTYDKLMGDELRAICVDAKGRRCTMGGHFKRAQEENAFPVRYFWECEPPATVAAAPAYPVGATVMYTDHHDRVQTGRVRSIEASWAGYSKPDQPPLIIYRLEHPTYRNGQHYAAEQNIIRRIDEAGR